MRIGIDGRIINKRGVGRYIANLVKNLVDIDKKNTYFIYLDKNSVLTDFINSSNCTFKRLNTSNAYYFENKYLPREAKKDKVDILHGTDNTVTMKFKGKKIVTIHDTMFVRPLKRAILKPTLKQKLVDIYNKIAIPSSAKGADAVITVSDYSKQDIIKNTGISEDKITVIHEAADKIYKVINNQSRIESIKNKLGITKPYIMVSAASDLRKNTIRTIEAFNMFNNLTEYKYQMVITSIGRKEMETTNIMDKIRELNLEKYIVITEYVQDKEMVLLYNGAFMFLFPSIWEGFGLQVLEAFACGLPVITSGNTSLKEIAGDAAEFIDPFSTEDIVRGMIELEKSTAKRKSLIAKGFEREKMFSWKKTAQQTLDVYNTIFEGEEIESN